jgi:hypothetical protein
MSTTAQPDMKAGRLGYSGLAALLLISVVFEVAKHSTGYWQLAVFGLGPDLALVFRAGADLARGQLHPRTVPLYNAVHRFWGPFAVGVLAALGVFSVGYFIGALAWGFHIALDRSLGYGLRTPDGFQRS